MDMWLFGSTRHFQQVRKLSHRKPENFFSHTATNWQQDSNIDPQCQHHSLWDRKEDRCEQFYVALFFKTSA